MKRSCLLFASAVACALSTAAAHADTFSFSFGTSTDKFSGAGTLTASLQSSGDYLVTAIGGTTDTGNGVNRPISSLIAPGGFDFNDNLIEATPNGLAFDVLGLSYALKNGAMINLSTDISGDVELLERVGGQDVTERVPYTIAATPEPGSFVLLGTGLLGAVAATRRRLSV